MNRREFVARALSIGASLAWGDRQPRRSSARWSERRDAFAEGVASGDPEERSVVLWTRVSAGIGDAVALTVEAAEDAAFDRVIAAAPARALREADYTCRVLLAGLRPGRTYWYRFVDGDGRGSRIGRTRTAPAADDPQPVRFAFVSCQNISEGALNAYRRMIYEDERAAPGEQLAFVLHLGDFIYEVVDYPEDRPGGRRYDRRLCDVVRLPDGERISPTSHIAASLADYRSLYQAYLHDPDLQDARARWPFIAMWDNHEFSWMGWQSLQRFAGQSRPAQTRKVAANQAWFEYQPARISHAGPTLERFVAPQVRDAPIGDFDEHGLGREPNNLAAIGSLRGYRAFRWGRHLDLLITDQHSYRSEEPTSQREARAFESAAFPELIPQEVLTVLDAGREFDGGRPPETIPYGGTPVPNFRRQSPPQTILGAEQKAWFLDALRRSRATWKVWGCSLGTLDWRADPQNLPAGSGPAWPGTGYAAFGGGGDFSTAYRERAEIYDLVREAGIAGFVTVTGDRHSFWAGLAAKSLPPGPFEPIGVVFTTGSISAPGLVEAFEHVFPKDHVLRDLYLVPSREAGRWQPAMNMLLRHGVRSCLEYARTRDVDAARRVTNRDLAPHLSFVDMGGHGYATVRLSDAEVQSEFVCIPRPLERSADVNGGPVAYRLRHHSRLWRKGERPVLEHRIVEGDPGLGL